MRFQAVARHLDGELLKGENLKVMVELMAIEPREKVFYLEEHSTQSSELGLLDFVIGEGGSHRGKLSNIPWNKHDIWVRISVKTEKDDVFQIISSGQLFSVPYAMYADEAGSLSDQDETERGIKFPLNQTAIYWALDGNANAQRRRPAGPPVVGTTDGKDLIMITQNQPRMIITKDGLIQLFVNTDLTGDLHIEGNTQFNGSLTSGNGPTQLSGTLTVEEQTILYDGLTVANGSHTKLSGDLEVGGITRILGSIEFLQSLTVNGMHPTVFTGTLRVDGTTTMNKLVVANNAPTHLTGDLHVKGNLRVKQKSRLQKSLDVEKGSPTVWTGTLEVDQATTLNDRLTVANKALTHLTGDLKVDGGTSLNGDVVLNGKLDVANEHPVHLTGTLKTDGDAKFNEGLIVNGGGNVGPDGTHLAYFNNASGGNADGIAIKINAEDLSSENNYMTFYRGNSIAGRIESYNAEELTEIPLPTTTEIWAAACLVLADYNPLTLVWTQTANAFNTFAYAWNNATIPSFDIPDVPAFVIPDVPALAIPDVPAFQIPNVPGLTIPDIPTFITPDIPGLTIGPLLCSEICFCPCSIDITDWDCCCEDVCLIPGSFTVWPEITIPDFPGLVIPDFPGITVPDFPGIPIPDFPGIAIPDFPGIVIPEVPEINLKSVIGECPTIPTFHDILVDLNVCPEVDLFDIEDGYIRRLADWAYEHRAQGLITADPLKLLGSAIAWGLTTISLHNGVVYGSKGADYAEYLPKMYPTEKFMKGEVVGVYNGQISRNTENADQILAITAQPMVLGNFPDDDNTENYEQVAFLGQIPVFVKGPVALGDLILPSGANDGTAIAIKRDEVTADMLPKIIGSAWSSSEEHGLTMINTSIGLRPTEMATMLSAQIQTEGEIQDQIEKHRSQSASLQADVEFIKQFISRP